MIVAEKHGTVRENRCFWGEKAAVPQIDFNIYGNDLVGKLQASNNQRYYYLKDHLGSIRVTLDQSGDIDSWTDYYPFGKESRSSGNSANEQKEHFTGKERDYEIGLDYFGARYYNPEIGRWTTIDPLWEKHRDWTPYNYVLGNPIALVDPDGRQEAAVIKFGSAAASAAGQSASTVLSSTARIAGPDGVVVTAYQALDYVGGLLNQSAWDYEASLGPAPLINPIENAPDATMVTTTGESFGQLSGVNAVEHFGQLDGVTMTEAAPTSLEINSKPIGGKAVEAKYNGRKVEVVTHIEPGSTNAPVHIQISGSAKKWPIDPGGDIKAQIKSVIKKPKSAVEKLVKNVKEGARQLKELESGDSK